MSATQPNAGLLITRFLIAPHDDGFTLDEMTAYLREHGVSDIEAHMAVEGWDAQEYGPMFDFIAELGLPADAMDMTVAQLDSLRAFWDEARRERDEYHDQLNEAHARLRAEFERTGARTVGELDQRGQEAAADWHGADAVVTVIQRVIDGIVASLPCRPGAGPMPTRAAIYRPRVDAQAGRGGRSRCRAGTPGTRVRQRPRRLDAR